MPSRCYLCQTATTNYATCDKCRRKSLIKRVLVRTTYEGVAKDLLHYYKFGRARNAYKIIAQAIQESLPLIARDTMVVSVPTASSRRRLRGYDHAALVAKRVAQVLGLDYTLPLVRLNQSRQVGASRTKRFQQLETAFLLSKPNLLAGRQVLVIDDVVTTGATLEAVARQLKHAGAKRIDAAVFAQRF